MTEAHIKLLFHTYRSRPDPTYSGLFFSPTCMQICRPIPTFAATTREMIVRYQKDADDGMLSFGDDTTPTKEGSKEISKLLYSIHPIPPLSVTFGTQESCAAINKTPEQLATQAKEEGWVGMHVDLWDKSEEGLLIKVQYWWREEHGDGGKVWRQCLHDILYLGPKDGSEGYGEVEVRERGW
ncbi:hypothetical protein HBH53_194630 [Parastagonospora nodorum]|nr:hypothetical protein HBH53_194630 [Parastagonospora nodorum]KAH4895864.1 hypothetical protein HBI80_214060 [Parastagonospora nodorum]KAH5080043.1 hypothetical protein HBH95_079180 [Parastagonospora nodorum]KAH5222492.1 hypothetical protein HBI62_129130 [Parastagonospora nodorum]KAH5709693.1 hypothetical protein HBI20_186320 [Parastagonospora nodorum]